MTHYVGMDWAQAQATGASCSSWITRYEPGDEGPAATGSAGVREPRSPRPQSDADGVALDLPATDDDPPDYRLVIAASSALKGLL